MKKIRLWAVLGEGGVGKSTTVGHLMGHFGKGKNGVTPGGGGGPRDVLLRGGGYLTVVGRRQSLQEGNKTPEAALKIIVTQYDRDQRRSPAISSAYFNVLLALRTDRLSAGLPAAHHYLSYFISKGWQLESLAMLGPSLPEERPYKRFGVPTAYIYDPWDFEISQMVGMVRNHFGWA